MPAAQCAASFTPEDDISYFSFRQPRRRVSRAPRKAQIDFAGLQAGMGITDERDAEKSILDADADEF